MGVVPFVTRRLAAIDFEASAIFLEQKAQVIVLAARSGPRD
jgi:hypothetical protein